MTYEQEQARAAAAAVSEDEAFANRRRGEVFGTGTPQPAAGQ
jgi:hypothetical protein